MNRKITEDVRWFLEHRKHRLVISTPSAKLRVNSGRNLRSLTFVRDDNAVLAIAKQSLVTAV